MMDHLVVKLCGGRKSLAAEQNNNSYKYTKKGEKI